MAPTIGHASSSEHPRGNNCNRRMPMRLRGPSGDPNSSFGHCVMPRNRLTALLVDGQRLSRRVEKEFLEFYGVETHDVDNGQVAVDILASGANYNIILIDKVLPVLNGLEATRLIREMGVRTKMVGMVVSLSEEERQAFLAAGVDEVIEKPLRAEWLVPTILELAAQLL